MPGQAPQAPSMLFADRSGFCRAGPDRSFDHHIGVFDDKQGPTCGAVDRVRAQALHRRARRCYPKRRFADGKLGDDVVTLADAVQHGRVECRLVERHRR